MESKEPLVSVIMNCYNGEKYLKEAIDSVLAQTYTNFEIIFWDNVSTDRSGDIVVSYKDKRIKYFRSDEHVGLGNARNLALEKANGDYIAFLDVDDVWMSEKLEKQVAYLKGRNVGLVYTLTDRFYNDSKVQGGFKTKNRYEIKTFETLLLKYDVTLSSAIILKKTIYPVNQNFDPLLKQAEEADLFLRICYNYKAIRINEYLTRYRIHDGMMSKNSMLLQNIEDEYILSKMSILFPDFPRKYPDIIRKKKHKIIWRRALSFILLKDAKNARKELSPYIFPTVRFSIYYMFFLLGSKLNVHLFRWYSMKRRGIIYHK